MNKKRAGQKEPVTWLRQLTKPPLADQEMISYGFDYGCTESCAPGKVVEQFLKLSGVCGTRCGAGSGA